MNALRGQLGFTLIETVATVAAGMVLLTAGTVWVLGMHPGTLAVAAGGYDAALAEAQAVAAAGDGATLAFLARTRGSRNLAGFTLRVFRGRPKTGDAVEATNAMPVVSDATVSERALGDPPFAIFIGASGSTSGQPAYPQAGADGRTHFPAIPVEPPCPKGGFVLTFTSPQNVTAVRRLACPSSVRGPAIPNPSPTPNAPLATPAALIYRWPSDAEQTFVATEWGYAHWFATTARFACGNGIAIFPDVLPAPYSPPYEPAEGAASPAPPPQTPYSYPNSHGGSTNDAPAPFRLDPAAEGLCTATVADDYGQTARVAVQVMGWLSAAYRGSVFIHLANRVLAFPPSTFSRKGASATVELSKTYDTEPLQPHALVDPLCAPYLAFSGLPERTPASPSSEPATANLTLTLVSLPGSPVACKGIIYDQYAGSEAGEGIAFEALAGAPVPPIGR